MLVVRVEEPDGAERTLSFEKTTLMIGRTEGNDVCLRSSKGVSRYHARADVEDGVVVIQDLDSTNGTYVNSDRVQRKALALDDLVMIGDVVLSFSVRDDEAEPAVQDQEEDTSSVSQSELLAAETAWKEEAPVSERRSAEVSSKTSEIDFYWSALRNFLSPVWDYILDNDVTEVMINGPSEIYVERKGHLFKVEAYFTEAELKAAVLNIAQYVGRRVTDEEPYIDARLPDGSRVAVLMPPCSRKGISVSIRKFSSEALTLEKLIQFQSLSEEMITFLKAAVELRKNIVVSGGTSSGKTSLLNVVSGLIPVNERIITIEDAAELQLKQEHVLPMETRPPDKRGRGQITIRDLVRVSLRMRPDRIIVGEIRGGEALDLLQAMNTGHSGSMSTVHASSPPQALTRLETLALFSGIEIPVRALREQVSSAIDIIVQAARLPDHTRKVTHISEVGKIGEGDVYQVKDIFRFNRTGMESGKITGHHAWTGEVPGWIGEMELAGLTEAAAMFCRGANSK
ncbi:MAG TPA: ATPase, T2SS/T4P/T4SS family [Oligoflexia bacterium]|nr:ATPase, T2SS/T4P/T4SS family [Oligoflexia bacterium]